jgi:hypothetical protein
MGSKYIEDIRKKVPRNPKQKPRRNSKYTKKRRKDQAKWGPETLLSRQLL